MTQDDQVPADGAAALPDSDPSTDAPRRNWFRRHPWVTASTILIVLLVGGAALVGSQVYAMGTSLQDINAVADRAQDHAKSGDTAALASDLKEARDHAQRARSASGSLGVRIAAKFPAVGQDVQALRVVSVVASDLTRSADALASLLPNLASANDDGGDDGFDLTLLRNLQNSMSDLAIAAQASAVKLEPLTGQDLNSRIAGPVNTLHAGLSKVTPAVEAMQPYMDVLPIILGEGGERTWFVTMQNLTEARPSGGLLSAYIVVKTNEGQVELLAEGSNDDLEAGPPVPYDTMPVGLQDMWGDYLSSWLSMNVSANFPDNAQLIVNGWNEREEAADAQVDGVISLGQGTLPYLAAAVGPVKVNGKTIQPQDLTDYLTVGVYQDYADPAAKDDAVAQIIGQVFTKLASGHLDIASLVSTVSEVDTADYLQMYSTDAATQRKILLGGYDGGLSQDLGPQASVRFSNLGGNKLDAFLQAEADYAAGACVLDDDINTATRHSTLTVRVTNNAPTSGLPPYMTGRVDLAEGEEHTVGASRTLVLVYGPAESTLDTFTLDGADAPIIEGSEGDRPFAIYDVELDPGQSATIETGWEEPARNDNDLDLPTNPVVTWQPLLNTPITTVTAGDEC